MENKRLDSLDAFRGFDMMFLMGLSSVIVCICGLFPGGENCFLVRQMEHASWDGLTLMDLVFPTFLFIAGISFPYSYAKQLEKGMSQLQIHLKIFKRAAILVMFGWVVNGVFSTGFGDLRYGSVLSKTGLGWMFAAIYYVHFRRFTRILICAGLIVGYAILLCTIVAPDYPNASSLSIEGNFIGWLDRTTMPGKLWQGAEIGGKYVKSLCEPSGLYANFFAAATAMLGMFAGEIVRSPRFAGGRKALHLVAMSVGLLVSGLAMIHFVPLSKKLWSPSFTLCVGAYSTAMFALFYWLVDVLGWRKWTFFFTVIGMNSITIYMLKCFVDYGKISKFFLGGVAAHCSPHAGEFILACGYLAACWLTLYFLYRKKTFLKV